MNQKEKKENKVHIVQYVIETRNKLHQIPELSMQEFKTTEMICDELKTIDAEVTRWDDLTGAIGLIRGNYPGPTVAVRADIDALPITEASGNPYTSLHPGLMHACGHDAHTAIALGVGKYFSEMREKLAGNVKLLFQPGEEIPPGGAIEMIKRGVLHNPKVDAVFGLHHYGQYPLGSIAVSEGDFLLSMASFKIILKVKGGYGVKPVSGVDGILIAAQIITAIQLETTRKVDYTKSGIISFGTINGGNRSDILADEVTICGIVRAFSEETTEILKNIINSIANAFADLNRGNVKIEYSKSYPAVLNDLKMTKLVRRAASEVIGIDNVLVARHTYAGDDMAYFQQQVPGCYFLWGIAPSDEIISAHTPEFDITNAAFSSAVKVMIETVSLALKELR